MQNIKLKLRENSLEEVIVAQKEVIKRYKLYDWFNDYPWWVGYIGNIHSAVWFLGENPSLIQLDRQSKTLDCDINSQWNISLGDKLLRKAITEANLKTGEPFQNDGWY